jgi:peptide/nickel transport system permease protein
MRVDPQGEMARSTSGRIGVALLLVILLMAILAPLLATQDPLIQTTDSFKNPSWEHPLGTNHAGQDIWSQLVYGARTSLLTGFMVAGISTVLSAVIGGSAALIGGIYERMVTRLVDVFLIIPMILLLILLSVYVAPNLGRGVLAGIHVLILLMLAGLSLYMVLRMGWAGFLILTPITILAILSRDLLPDIGGMVLILSLLCWQGGARIVRAQTLSLKEKGHVSAARGFGAGTGYILQTHILPDLGPILLAEFIFCVRRAVFLQAGLAFLGIGDPGVVSWGSMINDARDWIFMDVWKNWLVPSGAALSATIVAITLIGHSLETVLDPRLRGDLTVS